MEGVRSGYFAGFLPFYAPEHLLLGPAAYTLAFTLHQLAENLAKSLGGFLAERVGLGLMVSLGASVGLWVLLLTPGLDRPSALWTLSALWGLFLATNYPGLMTLASRMALPGREARALSFTLSLLFPWIGLGVVGVGQVAGRHPEGALRLLLLGQGLALLLVLSLVRLRIPLPRGEKAPTPWRSLLLFVPLAFGLTFAPGLVSLFVLRFARENLGLEPLGVGAILALAGGLAFLLLPLTGRLADRRRPYLPLALGTGLLGLVMLGLGQKPPLLGVLALALLGGLGFSLLLPGWNGLLARRLPQANRAALWGGLMTLEGLGIALGPLAGGFLWEARGSEAPFLLGGLVFLALSLYVLWLRGLWKS